MTINQNLLDSVVYREVDIASLSTEVLLEVLLEIAKYGGFYDQYWNVNDILIDIKNLIKKRVV